LLLKPKYYWTGLRTGISGLEIIYQNIIIDLI